MANITKEWLEMVFGEEVESFVVKKGSNAGDGYTSVLIAAEVHFPEKNNKKNEEKLSKRKWKSPYNILIKCYPAHAARQEWLSQSNLFQKELMVYSTLLPEFVRFQRKPVDQIIQPPTPDFIYGKAVDYKNLPSDASKFCADPLDNCIVMPDLRIEGGFRLADRLVGFDLAHSRLVIEAQAKLHALSWAYKMSTNTESFIKKFPFLLNTFFDDMEEPMIDGMMDNNVSMFRSCVESLPDTDEKKEGLLSSVKRFREVIHDVIALWFADTKKVSDPSLTKDNILRVPQPPKENEEPWLVCCHGDSWLNNEMFRYDDAGKPIEVVLVDLQIVREGDPMTDVVYSMYTSTTSDFRKQHLDELLKLYMLTFIQVCEQFQVTPFPGFSFSELKRRFHRAKMFGFLMCIVGLPLFLNDPGNAKDLENMKTDMTPEEFIEAFQSMSVDSGNIRFKTRALDVITELHEEGVI